MLQKDCGIKVAPQDIWQNNFPAARIVEACRWGVTGTDKDGNFARVCSWDRMSEIVQSGKIAVITCKNGEYEVGCED